ncbi:DUF3152 domain-containing protein [Streptomyces sp. NPDC102467]|uniref:DUF3152 domain-containing protein n=1 Tax=Streptomyces sp. NPDC102467 TaxID=3366179 RepID=UPI003805E7EB
MGRHSRREPADNGDTADISVSSPIGPSVDPSIIPSNPSTPFASAEATGPVHPGSGRRRRKPAEASAATHPPTHPPTRPAPHVRGGHPERRESTGGWGAPGGRESAGRGFKAPDGPPLVPRQRPRQEYVDAFDKGAAKGAAEDPYASVTDWDDEARTPSGEPSPAAPDPASAEADGGREKRGKGLTYTGIAAAAVTTVLAVVVAGQVTDRDTGSDDAHAQAADGSRVHDGSASRSDGRATPSKTEQAAPATYTQKMSKKYPLAANLKASGDFEGVPGFAKAPGQGQKFRYRIDVEKGLGLDSDLFAQAVQKTLNDKRSWAHDHARTFERISSGKPDFVITLASPGTTADWCAKSGLDTTEDNVSCDSAATERVMINAYRWAQGSKTYDDVLHGQSIYPYRQMLINHEVGHRLGFNHVTCSQKGALAPVMQQQTKFLSSGGITCKPNPWVFPKA